MRRAEASPPRVRAWSVVLALALLAGCETAGEVGVELGAPGASQTVTVVDVKQRGEYLDARLQGTSVHYRLLFPNDGNCQRVIRPQAQVTYATLDPFGTVTDAAETRCDPVGILSLREWLLTHLSKEGIASHREGVAFRITYHDREVAFARGSYPLARAIGVRGAHDLMMVIPEQPRCEEILQEGRATLQVDADAAVPYQLLLGEEVCPVLGFAQPPGGADLPPVGTP